MMRKRKLTLTQKRMINGYLFILPWLIGFIIFYVRSIILTTEFSFSELTVGAVGGYELEFVGLDNFIYAFREHGTFKQILTTSVGNMILDIPLIIFFSLFMAILLNRQFKGRTLIRVIFFLPVILNSSAISTALELSQQMMAGGISAGSSQMAAETTSTGVDINYYIGLFKQLAMPDRVLDYIVAAVGRINNIITASGVQIVIFLAALQSIPGSMYEVAKIEGATAYETFWKVTFPIVMPHIITNVVYTVIDNFAESQVVTLAYDTAFTDFNYGLSSVFSLISTAITCLILVLIVGFIQKRTFYYN
ncbi:MAG: sugar ABC transporter permease [Anaerolineaceae bacterium]|nr:MAG: sugar ABC transporter permease [Anaerolineaceae bacterium]